MLIDLVSLYLVFYWNLFVFLLEVIYCKRNEVKYFGFRGGEYEVFVLRYLSIVLFLFFLLFVKICWVSVVWDLYVILKFFYVEVVKEIFLLCGYEGLCVFVVKWVWIILEVNVILVDKIIYLCYKDFGFCGMGILIF